MNSLSGPAGKTVVCFPLDLQTASRPQGQFLQSANTVKISVSPRCLWPAQRGLLTVMTLLSSLSRPLLLSIAAACANLSRSQALVLVDLDRGGVNLNPQLVGYLVT